LFILDVLRLNGIPELIRGSRKHIESKEKKSDEKKRSRKKAENRKEADVYRASGSQTADDSDIGI